MAKIDYEKVYKQLKSEREARQSALKKSNKNASVQSEIDNLKTRMGAAGVDVDNATDKRNVVEKVLGLPDDQNILFDIFELLGRPQQALFGAWNENQNGGDLGDSLKSAWEHFKGDKETQFKDILMDNRIGLEFDDEKGKADLVDWLGFAGDVALDPADWAFIAAAPVTGGTSLTGLASNVKDVAKVADNAIDAAQAASKSTKVVRKSLSDLAFEGMGKAIKGTAKLADTGITNALKYADETKGIATKAGDLVKLGYTNKTASSVADLGKYVRNVDELVEGLKYIPEGNLEKYVKVKETIKNAFKLKDELKNALKVTRKSDFITDTAKKRMRKVITEYSDDVTANVNKIGMSADEINKAMTDMIEFKGLNRTYTGEDILEAARRGTLAATDENKKIIDEIASTVNDAGRKFSGEDFKLGYKTDNGVIRLDQHWKKEFLENLDDGPVNLDPELLAKEFTLSANYTDEQLEYLKKLEENKNFMDFYEKHKDLNMKLNSILDEEFGKNFVEEFAKNKGYVPHSYTGFATNTGVKNLIDDDINLLGNKRILGERTRLGSVLEENTISRNILEKNYDTLNDTQKAFVDKHKEIFESNYEAAISKKYLDELPKLLQNDRNVTEILVNQSFGDIDGMLSLDKKIKEASIAGDKATMNELAEQYNKKFANSSVKPLGPNGEVPVGYEKLGKNANKIANKLETMAKQLGNGDVSHIAKQLRDSGDKLAIDSYVLNLVRVVDEADNVKPLSRMMDQYLGFYKRWKISSPTYLMNNLTGNMSNMWLSGIDIKDQMKYTPEALKIIKDGPELFMRKKSGEILSAADNKIADLYEKIASEGFAKHSDSFKDLMDLPESLRKYFNGDKSPETMKEILYDGIPYLNSKGNEFMDNLSRTVVMLKSIDDPTYLAKLGLEAGDYGGAIRRVMFDASELTQFEKDWMTKIIPFYTFAKKNLAYQVDNLGKNGGRYHRLIKSVQGLQDLATDGNRENIDEYIKNNLYVPVPGLSEDGSYTVLRTQMPFGNLIDLASDPLSGALSMVGPLKTFPELAMNKNMFTGADIEKYPGQMSSNIPFLTKKQEHMLGGFTGFDVPLKTGSRLVNGINDTMQNGGNFFEGIGQGVTNNIAMERNINTDELSRMYDELDELEVLMQQYKGMGYEFATMNELKKANPNTVTNKIMAQLDKINGTPKNPYADLYK